LARFPPRAARGRLALALWALALVVVVVVLATWVAGRIAESQERDTVDTRLAANMRVGREEFADALAEAQVDADRLATSPQVQRALATGNAEAAERIADAEGNVGLIAGDELLAGSDSWPASRAVDVIGEDGETIGRVVVGVPLDEELVQRLARAAGALEIDAMVVTDGDEVVASSPPVPEGTVIPPGTEGSTRQGGEAYRYVSTPLLEGTDIRLAALSSEAPVSAAVDDTRQRAFIAALATVVLALLLAWTISGLLRRRGEGAQDAEAVGRRARDVRSSADEARMREAVALVGDALAATHDPEALLPVILQSAIEATGAVGARLVSGGTEVVRTGKPEEGGKPLALKLGSDEQGIGKLMLYPPRGGSFDGEAEQLAHWLAAQASIAIENERLHRTVKRQAITDELTQLSNRRRFTETLAVEVRRAERFGDPLSLVLADLDDFKQINDRYGHQAGDEVLRRFADVLRENVRDFDLPVRYGGEEFAVDLTEDVEVTRQVKELSAGAGHAFIPQCGLAPGYISIAAHHLMTLFDSVDTVKMRVGALPVHPSNALKYSLTWSTDGLINEYGNMCYGIERGQRVRLLPLEGYETIEMDGLLYEAFNTSGGLGTLADTYEGAVRTMNYKTLRYPGHCEKMHLLMNDLKLNDDRDTLKRILERAIPQTLQDVVLIYAAVTGVRHGELFEETYVKKVYPQTIRGRLWSAIQVTTASALCSVVDLVCTNPSQYAGFVTQETFSLPDILANRFGTCYR
jgi:GGDEF domain-containing protein